MIRAKVVEIKKLFILFEYKGFTYKAMRCKKDKPYWIDGWVDSVKSSHNEQHIYIDAKTITKVKNT